MKVKLDKNKAEQVILYICKKMGASQNFGSVLLNKALFYIDHVTYLQTGKSLTGLSYIKQKLGPTPQPSQFLSLRDKLIDSKKLTEKNVTRFGLPQKRLVARVEAKIGIFTPEEIALMDQLIEELSQETATNISEITHQLLGWRSAGLMEPLPYCTFLLTESDLNDADLDWGKRRINEHASIHNN